LNQYRNYYWHDLFDAVVCDAFLFVTGRNKWASLALLFLLCLTGESAIVLVLVIVIVALMKGQRTYAAASLLVGAFSGGAFGFSCRACYSEPVEFSTPLHS
jgi:predicted MFS family arabinose efflux permease